MKKLTTKQKHRNQRLAKSRHQNKLDRKGKGAQYGLNIKIHDKFAKLFLKQNNEEDWSQSEHTEFVDDPTQTLKDKMAKADKGTLEIS